MIEKHIQKQKQNSLGNMSRIRRTKPILYNRIIYDTIITYE